MNNTLYDILRKMQTILPAIGTLYYGLADIWNLPCAEQVVGSITVIVTFLGVLIEVCKASYDKASTTSINRDTDSIPVDETEKTEEEAEG